MYDLIIVLNAWMYYLLLSFLCLLESMLFSGNDYPAVVEFATFQKVPKKKVKKPDSKKGMIEQGKQFFRVGLNLKNMLLK